MAKNDKALAKALERFDDPVVADALEAVADAVDGKVSAKSLRKAASELRGRAVECDPERCLKVADMFKGIERDLLARDVPEGKVAMWDSGTFGFTSARIRQNARRWGENRG